MIYSPPKGLTHSINTLNFDIWVFEKHSFRLQQSHFEPLCCLPNPVFSASGLPSLHIACKVSNYRNALLTDALPLHSNHLISSPNPQQVLHDTHLLSSLMWPSCAAAPAGPQDYSHCTFSTGPQLGIISQGHVLKQRSWTAPVNWDL
jgi:hypothetical protein